MDVRADSLGRKGRVRQEARPARPAVSLRTRLLMLVASLLAPALCASAFLVWQVSQQAYRAQERQLVVTASTLALVVDRQLSQQTALLNALASSETLDRADWDGFDRRARLALAGSADWIVVKTLDGQQVVNTLAPRGAKLPKVAGAPVNAIGRARADGVRVSDMAMGALAKEPVIIILKTVTLRDGRVVDLSVVTPTKVFSDLLRRQPLPPRWTATILDGSRRVLARSRNEPLYRGRPAAREGTPRLAPGGSGLISGRSLDGVRMRAAFEPVADWQWTVIVGVPRDELLAPAQKALRSGALLAIALFLGGIAMAAVFARPITRSVKTLQAAVADGAGGHFERPKLARVREIEDLAAAFQRAAEKVAAHSDSQQLLINELNHRVKNTLATLQSVSRHTRRSAATVEEFHAALEGRIMALSAAHELLTGTAWSSTDLGRLARAAIKPFEGPRMTVEGPAALVEPTDALNLALIFHELATNAAKHGALSGTRGTVALRWSWEGDVVRIEWAETGGPPVRDRQTRGFGSRLIETVLVSLTPSAFEFEPTGVRCRLTVHARRS